MFQNDDTRSNIVHIFPTQIYSAKRRKILCIENPILVFFKILFGSYLFSLYRFVQWAVLVKNSRAINTNRSVTQSNIDD